MKKIVIKNYTQLDVYTIIGHIYGNINMYNPIEVSGEVNRNILIHIKEKSNKTIYTVVYTV